MKNEKSKVFFVSFSQANLCRGGGGARRPQKLVAIVDLFLMHHKLELQKHIAEWCMRRFASTNEMYISEENSGVRAGALWSLVQRPDISFVDSLAQGAVKG